MEAAHHLTAVLLELLKKSQSTELSASSEVNRLRVERVIEHMANHLGSEYRLDDLAIIAGISRSRLTSVFREYTGYSPLDYVRELRVRKARALLSDSELSIKEIAAQVGFDDALHFSKVFRKVDGLAPSQFRAAALAGKNPPP